MESAQIDLLWTLLTSRAIPLLRLIVLFVSTEWCGWFWVGGSFGLLLTATAFVVLELAVLVKYYGRISTNNS